MKELNQDELLLTTGGVKWGKLFGGIASTLGGVASAALAGWTGAGAVAGGVAAITGVGTIIDAANNQ